MISDQIKIMQQSKEFNAKIKTDNNKLPTVSVIIPCYNGAAFLVEAIESVLSQSYSHYEIIVVDDGSIDNTREIAQRYTVKYIYQKNQGVVAARNRGITEASGNYLVFLDQDDILLPNALEIGINSLHSHPECGFVAGLSQSINAEGSPMMEQDEEQQQIKVANYQTLLMGQAFVPPSSLIFQKAAVESIKGFNSNWNRGTEDYDLYLRIARKFPIYCHNQIVVKYRRHDSNVSNNAARILEECLKVLDFHWSFIKGNQDLEKAYKTGKRHWIKLFGPRLTSQLIAHLKTGQWNEAIRVMFFQLKIYPQGFWQYVFSYFST